MYYYNFVVLNGDEVIATMRCLALRSSKAAWPLIARLARNVDAPGCRIRVTDQLGRTQVLSCTIIVSGASKWMEPFHDRMPVLLEAKDFDAWLNGALPQEALRPAAETALRELAVSKRLNRTGEGDDDSSIIEPIFLKA